jgi:flagellar FliL protein
MAAKSTADDTAPGKNKKKMIIVGALAGVLLLGGGVGGTYMLTKPAAAATETVEEALEPGEVVALDPISVNLPDGHYLKVGIALQTVLDESAGEGSSAPDGSKALDLTIKEFSGKPMADLSNPELRQKYQDELQEKIIEAYTKEPVKEGDPATKTVMGIYLTQFVMQ